RAFFCTHSIVLRGAPSAFCRKSKLPLSSTTQSVTSTCRFSASASAAATIVLIAARFRYFLLGSSAEDVPMRRAMTTTTRFVMLLEPSLCAALESSSERSEDLEFQRTKETDESLRPP